MNKERMYEVADFVEKENYRFDMKTWGHAKGKSVDAAFTSAIEQGDFCGTVACVAGTANLIRARQAYVANKKRNIGLSFSWREYFTDSAEVAREWLGLSHEEARMIFLGGGPEGAEGGMELETINRNRKLVPDALRYMADTGDVHWRRAFKASRRAAACRAERAIDVPSEVSVVP